MKTKNKVLCLLGCLIIVVGIIFWMKDGFSIELQYADREQINLTNKKSFDKLDIEQIASEVLGSTRYFVQEVEMFGNSISIVADEITEEQRNDIVKKTNEKYNIDIKAKEVEIVSIPAIKIQDIIKPYIVPGIVTIMTLLVYFLIRFKDLNWKKVLAKVVIIPIFAELLLYSVIAITKIPFGRIVIACGIGLYVITIYILTNIFENQKQKIKAEKLEAERK